MDPITRFTLMHRLGMAHWENELGNGYKDATSFAVYRNFALLKYVGRLSFQKNIKRYLFMHSDIIYYVFRPFSCCINTRWEPAQKMPIGSNFSVL